MVKKTCFVIMVVLASIVHWDSAIAGGGLPVPELPPPILIGATAHIDGIVVLQGRSTTKQISLVYLTGDKGRQLYEIPTIGGVIKANSSDDGVLSLVSRGGEVSLNANSPGIASVYYTRSADGKVMIYNPLGEMVTVIDSGELAVNQGTVAVFTTDKDFYLPGDLFRLRATFIRNIPEGIYAFRISGRSPDGKEFRLPDIRWQGTLTQSHRSLPILEAPIDPNEKLLGEYHFLVEMADEQGKILARGRFTVSVGKYGFPGVTSSSLEGGSLWNKNDRVHVLSLWGVFPSSIRGGSVKVLFDGELVSQAGNRNFVRGYERFGIIVDVRGLDKIFTAGKHRVDVLFEDTAIVLSTEVNLWINFNDIYFPPELREPEDDRFLKSNSDLDQELESRIIEDFKKRRATSR